MDTIKVRNYTPSRVETGNGSIKQRLIDFYLDWVNNYISTAGMAEAYGLSDADCLQLIEMGKRYHNNKLN